MEALIQLFFMSRQFAGITFNPEREKNLNIKKKLYFKNPRRICQNYSIWHLATNDALLLVCQGPMRNGDLDAKRDTLVYTQVLCVYYHATVPKLRKWQNEIKTIICITFQLYCNLL